MLEDIDKILISESEIREKIHSLSQRLMEDYKDKELTMIAILSGSLIFLSDLIRLLPMPLRLDTIGASAYEESTSPKGAPVIFKNLRLDIQDRDVLVVDDIVDTGGTLSKVLEDISKYNPKSLKTCVLLDRPNRRIKRISPDYYCFKIGNEFVVGYGLDYNNRYRNLPFIAVLRQECYQRK